MREDIINKLKDVIKLSSPLFSSGKKKPEYYKTYHIVCELAERASYHLIKGVFPSKLFESKSPGQSKEEYEYSKNNFRQTTLPIGMDYLTTISRCLSDLNNNIKISDADFNHYAMHGIKEFNSINNWIVSNLGVLKTLDPNGVIVINPGLKTYINKDGEEVISPELNEPQIEYYDSSKIIAYKDEDYCIIDKTEYGKIKPKILTYSIIDTVAYYIATYDISTKELKYEMYYEHGWDYLPVQKLKGIPRYIDGELVWYSPFHFITDMLDSILINSSTLQNVIFKCGYPTRVYIGKKCNYTMKSSDGTGVDMVCDNGIIHNIDTGTDIKCPSCNGTGYADRFSELHDYIIQPPSAINEGESKVTVNPFSYVSPDTDVVRFLEEHIAKTEEKARKILHIQSSNSEVKGTENLTATGMVIDNKQMFAFIKPISDQIYDTIKFIYDGIAWMRYKQDDMVVINVPKDFDFKSEKDYMLTIKTAYDSGVPPFVIHSLIERYAMNYYASSADARIITDIILKTDRLIGMTNEDINIYYLKGQIEDYELLLHHSPFYLINEIIKKDDSFILKPNANEILIEFAKTKAKEISITPSPEDRIKLVLNE